MGKTFEKSLAIAKATWLARYFNEKLNNICISKLMTRCLVPVGFIKYLNSIFYKAKSYSFKKIDLCVIVKNEAPYIKEWINYHRRIGIDNFYIYNNDSNDNIKQILIPYMKKGYLHFYNLKGKVRQLDAYNLALQEAKKNDHYLLALDADEFLFLPNPKDNLTKICNSIFKENKKIGGIVFNWVIFGSSHYEKKQHNLVTQTFKYRSKYDFEANKCVKSLVDPNKTLAFLNPHCAVYKRSFYAVNLKGDEVKGPFSKPIDNPSIRINHYFTKSKEEFMAKRARGMADQNGIRSLKDFTIHDKNDIFDDSMKRYNNYLKKKE